MVVILRRKKRERKKDLIILLLCYTGVYAVKYESGPYYHCFAAVLTRSISVGGKPAWPISSETKEVD